jgi:hypothetical protein
MVPLVQLGFVPCGVLEGSAPAAKPTAQLMQDTQARDWRLFTAQAKAVFAALGLPLLQAPGEADACCGVLSQLLQREGVQSVVISTDADPLAYGASKVIKEWHLRKINDGQGSSFKVADAHAVCTGLGIVTSDPCAALRAMSLLVGNAYDQHGVHGIGEHNSVAVVQHALQRCHSNQVAGRASRAGARARLPAAFAPRCRRALMALPCARRRPPHRARWQRCC